MSDEDLKADIKKGFKEAVEAVRRKASGHRIAAFYRLVVIATAFAETVAEAYRLPYIVGVHSDWIDVTFGAWGQGRRTWKIEFFDTPTTICMTDAILGNYEGSIDGLPIFLEILLANEESHGQFERCRTFWDANPQVHSMTLKTMCGTWV